MPQRGLRLAAPQRDLAEMEPRLGETPIPFERPPKRRFGAFQVAAPQCGPPQEVMGAPEVRIDPDRLLQKRRRAFVVAVAPGEIAELEQRPGIAGRQVPMPLEGEPRRPEALPPQKRGAEIGEHVRVPAESEPERLLQFRLGLRPPLHPQQQPTEEATQIRIDGGQLHGGAGFRDRFGEPAGGVERRRGQIAGFHAPGRQPGNGPEGEKRRLRLAELSERLPEREMGVHELRVPFDGGAQVRRGPRRLAADQPEDPGPLMRGGIGIPSLQILRKGLLRARQVPRLESGGGPLEGGVLEIPGEEGKDREEEAHESESPSMLPRSRLLAWPLLLAGACGEPPVLPVGGDIARPARVRFVPPEYPEAAAARGEEALVILELTLDPEGGVAAVRSLRGPEVLAAAAVEAAEDWAYEPTLVDGTPVALRFAETVRFMLRPAGGFGMRLPPAAGATGTAFPDLETPNWEIRGHAFTACPCDTPCPCRSNAPPSHPPCHAATATRLESGRYGDTDLAGVTFVTLGPESWVALYLNQDLDREQEQAVLGIFRSLAPGAPQRYRAIRRVPLAITSVREAGAVLRRAFIPGVLEMETRLPITPDGALREQIPGMDVWANRIAYGRTGVYRYRDPAIPAGWDHSGRQSNGKQFALDLGMYREGRMLIQHGDGSGDWTDRQRAIFTCSLNSRPKD